MATTKKKGKAIQFQIGWAGLIAITVSCVCVLLWTFVLGFWMGQKVATGNSSEPEVSVYQPKGQNRSQVQQGPAQLPPGAASVQTRDQASSGKELTALKESLKKEASLDGIKTEVLPGLRDEEGNVSSAKQASAIGSAEKAAPAKESTQVAVQNVEKKASDKKETEKQAVKKEKTKKARKTKKVETEKLASARTSSDRPFALQIASYRTRAQARKEASRWKKKGYYVRIKSADLGRKGVWYRVYLGRYRSLEEAKRASVKLASKEGVRSYVTKVSK